MGLCASANTDRSSSDKYQAGSGNESKDNSIKRKNSEGSISNVTETKTETALAAAKARRLVISDQGGFEVDASFVCPKFDKTDTQSKFLSDALTKNFFMFKELEENNQTDLIGAMQLQTINKSGELMRQGDDGDQMYVVESGTFDIIVNGNVVKSSGAKGVIGELALIYQVRDVYLMYYHPMCSLMRSRGWNDIIVTCRCLSTAVYHFFLFSLRSYHPSLIFVHFLFVFSPLFAPLSLIKLLYTDFFLSTKLCAVRLLVLHLSFALHPLQSSGGWIAMFSAA